MKWDGAFENLISLKSEAECVSHGTKVANKVRKSFNFKVEYICRKGVPLEPDTPNRRPLLQPETYGAAKRVKLSEIQWLSFAQLAKNPLITFQAEVFPEYRPDPSNALGANPLNAPFSRHSSGLLRPPWSSP
jgi:hypothetical protein